MLIEPSDSDLGAAGDIVDGGLLIPLFAKQGQCGRLQKLTLLAAAFLDRRREEILAEEKVGTSFHAYFTP